MGSGRGFGTLETCRHEDTEERYSFVDPFRRPSRLRRTDATPSTSERRLAKRLTEDGHPPVVDPKVRFSFGSGCALRINCVAWMRRSTPAAGGGEAKMTRRVMFRVKSVQTHPRQRAGVG